MRVHYLQHAHFEGLGAITQWLRGKGARVGGSRLFAGERLPDPGEADWVIAMGGPMSVNDEAAHPWLAEEKRYLRGAMEAGKVVLGVCLGAQLMAAALGARVFPAEHREVGWFPVEGDGRLLPARFTPLHWHGETFDLPPSAVRLARSEGCGNQAFRVGGRAVGIQFHLEVTREGAAGLCAACPRDLEPGRYVQTEDEMLGAAGRFREAGGVLARLLDSLAAAGGSAAAGA